MGAFQGLNQSRGQQQGGQLEPQAPEARQQGFAPASQNMAMLSGFQVALNIPAGMNSPACSQAISFCQLLCDKPAS